MRLIIEIVVTSVIKAVLPPVVTAGASRILTGSYMRWLGVIPTAVWIAVMSAVFVLSAVLAIRKKTRMLRAMDVGVPVAVGRTAIYGWISLGYVFHLKVLWRVISPAPRPSNYPTEHYAAPSDIEIDLPPRCPRCKTELEERHRLWGGYTWLCVGCGFYTKSKNSFYLESDRVERIARRQIEKQHEQLC